MSETKVVKTQIAFGRPEELTNIITHAIGAVLGFVGLVFLMLRSAGERTGLELFSVFMFGFSVVATFAVSAVYHAMRPGTRARNVMHRLDHAVIGLLMAGTYVPALCIGLITRGSVQDATWGYVLMGIIAVGAALTIVFNTVDYAKYKVVCLVIYVIMAWAFIVRISAIFELCGSEYFWMLIGGAAVYAIGVIFYAVKKVPFNHAIWHIFMLGGAAMHFVCLYTYLL